MSEEEKPGEVSFEVAASVVKSQFEPTTSIRIAVQDLVDMGIEVRALRDQVDSLQQAGTTQLSASRAACFEAAAMTCEAFAAEIPQNKQAQIYCAECAKAIRELANR